MTKYFPTLVQLHVVLWYMLQWIPISSAAELSLDPYGFNCAHDLGHPKTREEWNQECKALTSSSNGVLAYIDASTQQVKDYLLHIVNITARAGKSPGCLIGLKGSEAGIPVWEDGTPYDPSKWFDLNITDHKVCTCTCTSIMQHCVYVCFLN